MNTDFRVSVGFQHNIKVRRLKKKFGPSGPLSLVFLWAYAAQHCPEGEFLDMDDVEIEEVVSWKGEPGEFVKTLVSLRLLDREDGILKIHEWDIHNGYASVASLRSEKARRAARIKWGLPVDAQADANADALADATAYAPSPSPSPKPNPSPKPSPSPDEPKTAAPKKPAAGVEEIEIPDPLKTQEFLSTWESWKKFRREIKKPVTETAAKEQLSMLKEAGLEAAIRIIKKSIANSWQGLFPENKQHQGGKPEKFDAIAALKDL